MLFKMHVMSIQSVVYKKYKKVKAYKVLAVPTIFITRSKGVETVCEKI
jgi:hypothetical protein